MFAGEFMCLGFYYIKVTMQKRKQLANSVKADSEIIVVPENNKKDSINPLKLAVPAAFDTCGSTLMNIALTMTAASVY